LHLELHLRETEILLIDNPGSTVNDLRRWQNLLADESFHNSIAHLEFTRRLFLSYPPILSQEWLDVVIPAKSGDARSIPGLLLAGLMSMQRIKNCPGRRSGGFCDGSMKSSDDSSISD
jgi:hypothetical protein